MAPFASGLLVLTAPLPVLPRRAAAALAAAAGVVAGPLYVHLQPGLRLAAPAPLPAAPPAGPALLRALAALYEAAAAQRGLDLRVLLGPGRRLARPPRVLLASAAEAPGPPGPVQLGLQHLAAAAYGCPPRLPALLLGGPGDAPDGEPPEEPGDPEEALPDFSDVAVGGTFDRLHGAHRLLLSACCLLARHRLLAGVADGDLLRHKVLAELIEPYEVRAAKLREFLEDVKPSLRYDIVPLADPYGPSITDPDLQCLVVSEETRRGGEAVNKKRLENQDPTLPSRPYVIGLTGGTGSGKTSIAKLLGQLGAFLIDADKLGHAVYVPGGPAYERVVAAFGAEIVNEDGTINRKVLGAKVFGNQERLKSLTDIVWPEMARMVKEQIREADAQGKAVCVLDAAVLLEAGWQDMVHEVWTAVIPEEEAVKRIMARDGLSEEVARGRLRSQMTNSQRVEQSQVVLCTLWEPDVTRKQVEKAWDLLQQRLSPDRGP
ncbi:bifunctional coenzyme A synthase isoform X2 [Rissa tridactyla]|uniref:bifunctional coenzyme A synthase isoform X2 n=1 Tax=Rissa tridactyla TaxID=75485 RepID=UPI0023BAADEF|nr:bifunctional coenzyme A synthase isoform X2 [Rissa tridactyla]